MKTLLNNIIGLTGYRLYKVDKSLYSYGEDGKRPELLSFVKKFSDRIKGDVIDVGSGEWGAVGSYDEVRNAFKHQANIKTFEISGNPDIKGDIQSTQIPQSSLDGVFIFETLEHVPDPFKAVNEIYRILKPGGFIIGSTPFIYEIHGEIYGDYWRFTRQGLKTLLSKFQEVEVKPFGRAELMPHHYAFIGKK
jgi:SAM-dependent methyltransferase